jgi:hypothetical protein
MLVVGKKGPLLFDAESGQPISAFAELDRRCSLVVSGALRRIGPSVTPSPGGFR